MKTLKTTGKKIFNKLKSSAKLAIRHPIRAVYRGALTSQTFKGLRGMYNVGKLAHQAHNAWRARNNRNFIFA